MALRRLRCAFAWIETSLTRVVLRDLDAPGKMSLTNDVETVVEQLLADGHLQPGVTKLYYFDSENDFAEIEYSAAGFVGFKHAVAP
jgi:hypothetical protein